MGAVSGHETQQQRRTGSGGEEEPEENGHGAWRGHQNGVLRVARKDYSYLATGAESTGQHPTWASPPRERAVMRDMRGLALNLALLLALLVSVGLAGPQRTDLTVTDPKSGTGNGSTFHPNGTELIPPITLRR